MLHQRRASLVAQTVKNPPTRQKTQVWSMSREDPGTREWQPTTVFLPGRILWTEEPGGLQFMGSQRVRHDWATNTPRCFKETKEHCQKNLNFQTKRNYWVLSRVWNFIPRKKRRLKAWERETEGKRWYTKVNEWESYKVSDLPYQENNAFKILMYLEKKKKGIYLEN